MISKWTEDDDRVLAGAYRRGMTTRQMQIHLFGEISLAALHGRIAALRRKGVILQPRVPQVIADPIEHRDNETTGIACDASYELRGALIRYGIRHGVDLGMGRVAFFAAAREHGLINDVDKLLKRVDAHLPLI